MTALFIGMDNDDFILPILLTPVRVSYGGGEVGEEEEVMRESAIAELGIENSPIKVETVTKYSPPPPETMTRFSIHPFLVHKIQYI